MSEDDKGNWKNEITSNSHTDMMPTHHDGTMDISKSNQIEEALKASEEKYRLLFENANEAIIVVQDNKVKFFNPQFVKL
ncbi:MAG: PAS domain-containing protein, partial [Methanothrix sp.]